jgi:translation initiation factor 2 alpha subunit (eIF-2alpha)
MELEEGQIVSCIVTKIVGTTVFVKIEDYGKEGTIITSEIAPGRIRNLREYVVPNKKIVCKILRVDKDNIYLSLRRVTAKERKEILDMHEKEKNLSATLKTLLKSPDEVIQKIKQESSLVEFFENAKENPGMLEKLMSEEEASKILKILKEKKEKEVVTKKKFSFSSQAEDGLVKIKSILPKETTYLAAGRYLLAIKDKSYKEANTKLNQAMQSIELKAKQEKCFFSEEK